MEEKNHTASTKKARCGSRCSSCCGWVAFAIGLIIALILGWKVLPELKLEEKKQPIDFDHVMHVDYIGLLCEDCHFLREDGSFSGLPTTESCANCHYEALTDNPEEIRFVEEYVETGKEIKTEWLVYQKQPDNVFFSHAAHSIDRCGMCHDYAVTADLCNLCHIDVSVMETPPVYKENVISGYSVDTMMMPDCESCHANSGHTDGITNASNACFVCHK